MGGDGVGVGDRDGGRGGGETGVLYPETSTPRELFHAPQKHTPDQAQGLDERFVVDLASIHPSIIHGSTTKTSFLKS